MKRFLLVIILNSFVICVNGQAKKASSDVTDTVQYFNNKNFTLNDYFLNWPNEDISKNSKPSLNFNSIENWITLGNGDKDLSLSCNGEYFAYTVSYTWHKNWKIDSLIIQSTSSSWRRAIAGAKAGFFSSDGKQYIYQDKDELYFIGTGNNNLHKVDSIISYQKQNGQKCNWIAYNLKNRSIVLLNLITGKEYSFKNVLSFNFEKNGSWFVYQKSSAQKELIALNLATGKEIRNLYVRDYKFHGVYDVMVLQKVTPFGLELQYENIISGIKQTIWTTTDTTLKILNYNLDSKGNQLVFTIGDTKGNQSRNAIWYWKIGIPKAIEKLTSQAEEINKKFLIKGDVMFTDNGRYIRFALEKKPTEALKYPLDWVKLDVWSYKDSIIQSTQLVDVENSKPNKGRAFRKEKFWAIVGIDDSKLIGNAEEIILNNSIPGDFIILTKSGKVKNGDRYWEKGYYSDSNWVVYLKDGSRHLLPSKIKSTDMWFSPNNKYFVYFDAEQGGNFYSYNLLNNVVEKISKNVPFGILKNAWDKYWPTERASNKSYGIAAWFYESDLIWVYDNYDIWQLDLTGTKSAINLTNSYGRLHQIAFKLVGSRAGNIVEPVFQGKYVLLKAYNEGNKYNGFYRIALNRRGNKPSTPEMLFMGPCIMEKVAGIVADDMVPLKATNVNIWIVKKQSAIDAPNYFLTKDFKSYTTLTNLQPQRKYNWLTSELHQFKQLDSTINQGVLYKPENFDSTKKYPVIIAFYMTLSDYVYVFPTPEFMTSPLTPSQSPAWLVSQGYLVFTPDIIFSKKYWGPSTINAVEGAAQYLKGLPFVDENSIAVVGHSNSGRFGYYLLTHSNTFAAISLGSGFGGTDIISLSLSLIKDGKEGSAMEWAEIESFGRGLGNLWQNKDVWLDHTAVLNADKVTSPLLLFHNKNDGDDVRLAVELYMALRRLDKRVWWLQYDEGLHGVDQLKDMKDFTIRYTQFFNHYLKHAPAPRWMTKGIPASKKGIDNGYDLDLQGSCSLPNKVECMICKKWNEYFKNNPELF